MGLSSVFSTAISGLQASEATIDVAGNNVANSNTIGFKSSQVVFATQFLQTLGLGSAPGDNNGGTNPRQIGLGTQVAAVTPNFSQGTLEISSSPSDLAIQGDGFFIVRSTTGEQLYTRNGKFRLNSENQLVTLTGDRLMGFGIDSDYQIQSTVLTGLTIPLGASAVAKATQNVFFQGTLTSIGDIGTHASIIESAVLGDSQFSAPPTAATISPAVTPNTATTTGTSSAGGGALVPGNSHQYRVTFVDSFGTETLASGPINVTIGAGHNRVTLGTIPQNASYAGIRIYRTDNANTGSFLVTELAMGTTSYIDTMSDATLTTQAALGAQDTLTGNYSYYVTYGTQAGGPGSGLESRPSPLIGPINAVGQRIQLTDIPVDTTGQWAVRRIYRNSADDPNTFYYVGEIDNNTDTSFTDGIQDSAITSNPVIDLNGPRAQSNTLLVNLLKRGDTSSSNLFQLGTLNFTGKKGGRTLETKSLTITSTTTVADLIQFYEQALGIHKLVEDPNIPLDQGSGSEPRGSITADGRIRFVGNNGVDNTLEIGPSAITLSTSSGTQQVSMNFGQTQAAQGQSAVADFLVYDSLGTPLKVRVTAVLERRENDSFVYRWYADSPNNDPIASEGINTAVGTGTITFNAQGQILSVGNSTVLIRRSNSPALESQFNLDFSNMSGLATASSTLAATRQDGFPPGKLTSFLIGEDGIIRGVFDNGTQRDLGQIRLARFANPNGLEQKGRNMYAPGVNSGLAIEGDPATNGLGGVISGAVELSNTDISQSLIQLITASTQYRGNARVITAAQQLLDELLNLRR